MPKIEKRKEDKSQTRQSHCAQPDRRELTLVDIFSDVLNLNKDLVSIVMGYLPKLDVICSLAHGSNQAYYPLYAKLLLTDQNVLNEQTIVQLRWWAHWSAAALDVHKAIRWHVGSFSDEEATKEMEKLRGNWGLGRRDPSWNPGNEHSPFAQGIYGYCVTNYSEQQPPETLQPSVLDSSLRERWFDQFMPITQEEWEQTSRFFRNINSSDWAASNTEGDQLPTALYQFVLYTEQHSRLSHEHIDLLFAKLPQLFHAKQEVSVKDADGQDQSIAISLATQGWLYYFDAIAWANKEAFAKQYQQTIEADLKKLAHSKGTNFSDEWPSRHVCKAYKDFCETADIQENKDLIAAIILGQPAYDAYRQLSCSNKKARVVTFFQSHEDAPKGELTRYLQSKKPRDKQAFLHAIYNYQDPRDSSEKLTMCDLFWYTVRASCFALCAPFAFLPVCLALGGINTFLFIFCFSIAALFGIPPVIGAVACGICFLVRWVKAVKAVNAPMYQDAKKLIAQLEQPDGDSANPPAP